MPLEVHEYGVQPFGFVRGAHPFFVVLLHRLSAMPSVAELGSLLRAAEAETSAAKAVYLEAKARSDALRNLWGAAIRAETRATVTGTGAAKTEDVVKTERTEVASTSSDTSSSSESSSEGGLEEVGGQVGEESVCGPVQNEPAPDSAVVALPPAPRAASPPPAPPVVAVEAAAVAVKRGRKRIIPEGVCSACWYRANRGAGGNYHHMYAGPCTATRRPRA